MISGDRGGRGVGLSLPIHLFGNVLSKNRRTCEPQCGGAPSCWKILETNLSSGKKYICIPRSFLVLNVCNQGRNLCSRCIIGPVQLLFIILHIFRHHCSIQVSTKISLSEQTSEFVVITMFATVEVCTVFPIEFVGLLKFYIHTAFCSCYCNSAVIATSQKKSYN